MVPFIGGNYKINHSDMVHLIGGHYKINQSGIGGYYKN